MAIIVILGAFIAFFGCGYWLGRSDGQLAEREKCLFERLDAVIAQIKSVEKEST